MTMRLSSPRGRTRKLERPAQITTWWTLLSVAMFALPGRMSAQPASPPGKLANQRVAILLAPLAPDIEARIHGQTADLAWRVTGEAALGTRIPSTAPDATSLVTAQAIASANLARVIIWVHSTPGNLELRLFDASSGRLLRRRFELPDGQRSAALEGLAVAVRSSLQAVAEGDAIGEPLEPQADETNTTLPDNRTSGATGVARGPAHGRSSSTETRTHTDGRRPPAEARQETRQETQQETRQAVRDAAQGPAAFTAEDSSTETRDSAGGPSLGLGLTADGSWLADGVSRGGVWSLSLEPYVSFAGIAVGLRLTQGLASVVESAHGQLSLTRRSGWLRIHGPLPVTRWLRLRPGIAGGLVEHTRRTEQLADGLEETLADSMLSAAVEGTLAAQVAVAQIAGADLDLVVTCGAQVLLAPPTLRYETSAAPPDRFLDETLWTVVPTLALGLVLR